MFDVLLFADRILDNYWTSASVNGNLFWGSYRPGVYLGLKARSSQSPVFGILWLVQFDKSRSDLRHNCDQGLKFVV